MTEVLISLLRQWRGLVLDPIVISSMNFVYSVKKQKKKDTLLGNNLPLLHQAKTFLGSPIRMIRGKAQKENFTLNVQRDTKRIVF